MPEPALLPAGEEPPDLCDFEPPLCFLLEPPPELFDLWCGLLLAELLRFFVEDCFFFVVDVVPVVDDEVVELPVVSAALVVGLFVAFLLAPHAAMARHRSIDSAATRARRPPCLAG